MIIQANALKSIPVNVNCLLKMEEWKLSHEHFFYIPLPFKDNGWDSLNYNIQPYWYEGLLIPYEQTDAEIHDHDLSEDGGDIEESEHVAETHSDEEFYLTDYDG